MNFVREYIIYVIQIKPREREGEEAKKQENCNRVYKNSATKLKKPSKIEREVNRERQRRKGRRRGPRYIAGGKPIRATSTNLNTQTCSQEQQ